jgi:cell division protein FtsB
MGNANAEGASYEAIHASGRRWLVYFWVLASLVAGVTTGRLLYLLWGHVAVHDRQLAAQQTAITELTETQTTVSDQANHLKALDTSTGQIQAALEEQARRLSDLERGQAGMQDQVNGINARWQKQVYEMRRNKAAVVNAPAPAKAVSSTPAKDPVVMPVQPAFDKHNETFSPDLKPAPSAYAQMSENGLVVWMTPRPGFPNPVRTSVIGYVRGLGMLVHNWEDNKHYFISDSGAWTADQR